MRGVKITSRVKPPPKRARNDNAKLRYATTLRYKSLCENICSSDEESWSDDEQGDGIYYKGVHVADEEHNSGVWRIADKMDAEPLPMLMGYKELSEAERRFLGEVIFFNRPLETQTSRYFRNTIGVLPLHLAKNLEREDDAEVYERRLESQELARRRHEEELLFELLQNSGSVSQYLDDSPLQASWIPLQKKKPISRGALLRLLEMKKLQERLNREAILNINLEVTWIYAALAYSIITAPRIYGIPLSHKFYARENEYIQVCLDRGSVPELHSLYCINELLAEGLKSELQAEEASFRLNRLVARFPMNLDIYKSVSDLWLSTPPTLILCPFPQYFELAVNRRFVIIRRARDPATNFVTLETIRVAILLLLRWRHQASLAYLNAFLNICNFVFQCDLPWNESTAREELLWNISFDKSSKSKDSLKNYTYLVSSLKRITLYKDENINELIQDLFVVLLQQTAVVTNIIESFSKRYSYKLFSPAHTAEFLISRLGMKLVWKAAGFDTVSENILDLCIKYVNVDLKGQHGLCQALIIAILKKMSLKSKVLKDICVDLLLTNSTSSTSLKEALVNTLHNCNKNRSTQRRTRLFHDFVGGTGASSLWNTSLDVELLCGVMLADRLKAVPKFLSLCKRDFGPAERLLLTSLNFQEFRNENITQILSYEYRSEMQTGRSRQRASYVVWPKLMNATLSVSRRYSECIDGLWHPVMDYDYRKTIMDDLMENFNNIMQRDSVEDNDFPSRLQALLSTITILLENGTIAFLYNRWQQIIASKIMLADCHPILEFIRKVLMTVLDRFSDIHCTFDDKIFTPQKEEKESDESNAGFNSSFDICLRLSFLGAVNLMSWRPYDGEMLEKLEGLKHLPVIREHRSKLENQAKLWR